MKYVLALTLLMSHTFGYAQDSYKFLDQAENYIKKSALCKRSSPKCTMQDRIELLQSEGKLTPRLELEESLRKSEGSSYFIPLSLDNQELLILAAATSLGVVAFANDQEIMDVVQENRSETTQRIATVGDMFGSGVGLSAYAAGSYFLGVIFKNNKLKQAGIFVVSASVATAFVGEAVKRIFGRVRPTFGSGPYEFFKNGNKSFYSGHTTQAFTIATVISEMYKEEYPIVPYLAYGMASITAYARMQDKKHWASDVIMGAIAGHLVTKLTLSALNGNEEGRGGLIIYPEYNSKLGELMINFEYTPKEVAQPMKCTNVQNPILRVDACFEEALNGK